MLAKIVWTETGHEKHGHWNSDGGSSFSKLVLSMKIFAAKFVDGFAFNHRSVCDVLNCYGFVMQHFLPSIFDEIFFGRQVHRKSRDDIGSVHSFLLLIPHSLKLDIVVCKDFLCSCLGGHRIVYDD